MVNFIDNMHQKQSDCLHNFFSSVILIKKTQAAEMIWCVEQTIYSGLQAAGWMVWRPCQISMVEGEHKQGWCTVFIAHRQHWVWKLTGPPNDAPQSGMDADEWTSSNGRPIPADTGDNSPALSPLSGHPTPWHLEVSCPCFPRTNDPLSARECQPSRLSVSPVHMRDDGRGHFLLTL